MLKEGLKRFFGLLTPPETSVFGSYQMSRQTKDSHLLCKAPFNNMYFNVHGQVGPCWLTLQDAPKYPESSLHEIWFSEFFQQIRNAIRERNLSSFCSTCEKNIISGNHVSVLAKLYDTRHSIEEYPSSMEFELSNRCNLECIMCKGELSSTIRKNREQLPPLNIPYNSTFVEQLEEFIPHLKEAKFLGGEPFLIDIYYNIWEKMIEINPQIEITITTNGTVLNDKVKRILDKLSCHIIISIDSVNRDTYEHIRIGAKYERVMENFHYFAHYASNRMRYLGVSVNPLRSNWSEMPDFVNFCTRNGAQIWFNTVTYPYTQALWTLPAADLQVVYDKLSEASITFHSSKLGTTNLQHYRNLVEGQIRPWLEAAKLREQERRAAVNNLSDDDLPEALFQTMKGYIEGDAYLPIQLKSRYLKEVKYLLAEESKPLKLRRLLLLPDSSCFETVCLKRD
jgi:MoaA/NifB/PqqE/SkfB family radical SAM enzyme